MIREMGAYKKNSLFLYCSQHFWHQLCGGFSHTNQFSNVYSILTLSTWS